MARFAVLTARGRPARSTASWRRRRGGSATASWCSTPRQIAVQAPAAAAVAAGPAVEIGSFAAVLPRVGNWRPDSTLAVLAALHAAGVPLAQPAGAIRRGRDHWRTAPRSPPPACRTRRRWPAPSRRRWPRQRPPRSASRASSSCAARARGSAWCAAPAAAELEAVLDSLWRLGDEVVVQRFCPPGRGQPPGARARRRGAGRHRAPRRPPASSAPTRPAARASGGRAAEGLATSRCRGRGGRAGVRRRGPAARRRALAGRRGQPVARVEHFAARHRRAGRRAARRGARAGVAAHGERPVFACRRGAPQPGREASVLRRHPWVYRGALADALPAGCGAAAGRRGDGRPLGVALPGGSGGSLALRMVAFGEEPWDAALLRRARAARGGAAPRLAWRSTATPAPRPRRGRRAAGAGHRPLRRRRGDGAVRAGVAAATFRESARSWLTSTACPRRRAPGGDGTPARPAAAHAPGRRWSSARAGCASPVDVEAGQKTGFFLDQRDNRRRLGELAGGARCSTSSPTPAASRSPRSPAAPAGPSTSTPRGRRSRWRARRTG